MKTTTIEKVIYSMLTEGTGKALCDSGGEDNRNWQRNQKKSIKDFQNEPEISYEIYSDNEIIYTINIFHLLTNRLELDDKCKEFNTINTKSDNWDSEEFYGVSSEAEDYLKSLDYEANVESFNTYNGESNLSQVLQGRFIVIENQAYLILQIHNGCDVRGGYTDARMFVADDDMYTLYEDVYGTIDDQSVNSSYNGHSLTLDDTNEDPIVKEDSKVELYLSEV